MYKPVQPADSRVTHVTELGVLTLRSKRDGDVHVIELSGELDLAGAPEVERELRRVEATDVDAIIVDLAALDFMDSSGIRLLVMAHRRSLWDSGRIVLRRPSAAVLRVLEIAGIAELLPIED
jgi:anti-sigma B factor antagonist